MQNQSFLKCAYFAGASAVGASENLRVTQLDSCRIDRY